MDSIARLRELGFIEPHAVKPTPEGKAIFEQAVGRDSVLRQTVKEVITDYGYTDDMAICATLHTLAILSGIDGRDGL